MSGTAILTHPMGRRAVLALGGAVLAGLAVREYLLTPEDFAGGDLSVEAAHEQANAGAVLLVDIRRPDEWASTGVGAGAQPLDMRRADFVAALDQLAGGDRGRPIALICARGVRSARLANQLAQAGFTSIIDVPEGMLGSRAGPGWLRAGLPVVAHAEALE